MLCILKAILAWCALAFIGTNLIGLVVRGFAWAAPSIDAPSDAVAEIVAHENRRMSVANAAMTLVGILATLAYVGALLYYFGVGVALAAGAIMASRVPDLVWEIRTGDRVAARTAPRGMLYTITTLMMWGALPLLWYSLCA